MKGIFPNPSWATLHAALCFLSLPFSKTLNTSQFIFTIILKGGKMKAGEKNIKQTE